MKSGATERNTFQSPAFKLQMCISLSVAEVQLNISPEGGHNIISVSELREVFGLPDEPQLSVPTTKAFNGNSGVDQRREHTWQTESGRNKECGKTPARSPEGA